MVEKTITKYILIVQYGDLDFNNQAYEGNQVDVEFINATIMHLCCSNAQYFRNI